MKHPFLVLFLCLSFFSFDQGDMIEWDENRPLTWEDFTKRAGADEIYRAFTYSGINFEVKGAVRDVKIIVTPYFDSEKSWVNPNYMTSLLLKHEQGHFDLTALVAAKMDEEMEPYRTTLAGFVKEETMIHVELIYDSLYNALNALQLRYDAETEYGTDVDEQARWNDYISKELRARGLTY